MNARIEKYLIGYNVIQFLGWGCALLILFFDYGWAFICITIFQVISVLEIFHAYKKWNNSSPLFCFLQVGARLMILYFVFKLLLNSIFQTIPYLDKVIYSLFASWCIAEIIRYGYYVSQLLKRENNKLAWLRYTAFIFCYPAGVICEIYILYLIFIHAGYIGLKILLVLILIAYMIVFPKLYLHLLKQRKIKLRNT